MQILGKDNDYCVGRHRILGLSAEVASTSLPWPTLSRTDPSRVCRSAVQPHSTELAP
jgi:hypothetical protein